MQRTMLTENHTDRNNHILSKESCQKTRLGRMHSEVLSGGKMDNGTLPAAFMHWMYDSMGREIQFLKLPL